jgi:hypothetical protein
MLVSLKPLTTKRAGSGTGSVIQNTVRIQGSGSLSKWRGSGTLVRAEICEKKKCKCKCKSISNKVRKFKFPQKMS